MVKHRLNIIPLEVPASHRKGWNVKVKVSGNRKSWKVVFMSWQCTCPHSANVWSEWPNNSVAVLFQLFNYNVAALCDFQFSLASNDLGKPVFVQPRRDERCVPNDLKMISYIYYLRCMESGWGMRTYFFTVHWLIDETRPYHLKALYFWLSKFIKI